MNRLDFALALAYEQALDHGDRFAQGRADRLLRIMERRVVRASLSFKRRIKAQQSSRESLLGWLED